MKRPFVVLAAGFVLGEVLALQYQKYWPVLLFLLTAAGAGGFGVPQAEGYAGLRNIRLRGAVRQGLLLLLLLAIFGGIGFARGSAVKGRLDREEAQAGIFSEARPVVSGKVARLEEKEDSWSFYLEDVRAEAGNQSAAFEKVWGYLKKEAAGEREAAGSDAGHAGREGEGLAVGKQVRIRGSLEAIEGPRNPGEFSFAEYYRSRGVSCRIFGDDILEISGEAYPYDLFLARLRLHCAAVLDRVCKEEDAMIFKAILLGDMRAMEPDIKEMYQKNGISHLLAISGQHLTIIGGGLYLILRRLGLGFGGSALLGGTLVVSYGILTGSSGSAMRAVIMILCLWAGAWAGRTYDSMSALALSAILLLWENPYLLTQSGFQLSFGAVAAIGGLSAWLGPALKLEKMWQVSLLVSLCVQIAITPLVVWQYYALPIYGIFLNLLVAPAVPVLMYSGLLAVGVGSFSVAAGEIAAGSGHYILAYYSRLCEWIEQLPGYSLVLGRPSMGQIAGYAGTAGVWIGGMVWGMRAAQQREEQAASRKQQGAAHGAVRGEDRIMKKQQAAAGAGRRGILRLALLFLGYGLAFVVLLPRPVKGLEIYCLDVGQGDGFVLRTGNHTVLVDGGSSSDKKLGENILEPCLESLGVTRIDYAIVSHGDADHISGLQFLLENAEEMHIRNLVLPSAGKGQEVYEMLEALGKKRGAEVSYMGAGERIFSGELELVCLYGGEKAEQGTAAGTGARDEEERNAHSLVLCADYGGFHMLFTGDMGKEQERALQGLAEEQGELGRLAAEHLGHVQVLKTAHHGSDGSSDPGFLACMPLQAAVISYGRGNSYGHPAERVVSDLKELGAYVLETGELGAIRIWTDGEQVEMDGFLGRKEAEEKRFGDF